jgi:hypothetical protein
MQESSSSKQSKCERSELASKDHFTTMNDGSSRKMRDKGMVIVDFADFLDVGHGCCCG